MTQESPVGPSTFNTMRAQQEGTEEARMITIGVDAHKRVHVAVAVDDDGRELDQWRGPNSVAGWHDLQTWARPHGPQRQWGIEGAWGYGRGLAQTLVSAGDAVYEINTRWTAIGRRSARRAGKTDLPDAQAIALCLKREGPSLPRVHQDDESAILDLLAVERDSTLVESTRMRNQIHALLTQIDPEYQTRLPNLQTKTALRTIARYRARRGNALQEERAASVRRLAARLLLTLQHSEELAGRIKEIAATHFTPLTELCGVNLLTAGTLAGILGPGRRFATDAQLAAYAGAAPLEASSAGMVRHRLNRGGNRRLNAVLYRIVLTQAHHSPEARRYLSRRVAEGKTKREAMRALKRYIVRAIWHLWQRCAPVTQGVSVGVAA